MQTAKILIFTLGVIWIAALVMGKSPWKLITGIGALSAVVLLIFKDSILGLVASVQMSAYDMVRIGDWIEMPKFGADGDVIEVSLHTVKVQNWDKTITTIPTQAFITDSFKNWRGMSESGGRRIKRAIMIDMQTVKFCSAELLERLERIAVLKDYLADKKKELTRYNRELNVDGSSPVNGRAITNLGTFRAYIEAYLRNNTHIHPGMTFLVRQLAPTEKGLPIEIYVFTNDTRWVHYEAVQSDIFDHLLAVIQEFDLAVFQVPSGNDLQGLTGHKD